jgi:hypothetical protein
MTVSGDTFRTRAASSTFSLPKKRSSTHPALALVDLRERLQRVVHGHPSLIASAHDWQSFVERHPTAPPHRFWNPFDRA